jgi:hypothetical protein
MSQAATPRNTGRMWIGLILTVAEALLVLGVATGVLLIRP